MAVDSRIHSELARTVDNRKRRPLALPDPVIVAILS
jgi:hypothetical protein